MVKQPTGKRNTTKTVYGRIARKPKKTRIHIPTPPPTPTAMNTVNNAEFANMFSRMKVSKGRKKTITLQPTRTIKTTRTIKPTKMSQSPTRKSTRIKFKPGYKEKKLEMAIDEARKREAKKIQTRRKKREEMEALNILFGNTKIGSNSKGSKSTRRKSTGRKLKRRNSKRR